ncbi:MAG: protease, partial [Jiangellaceae bacterium]
MLGGAALALVSGVAGALVVTMLEDPAGRADTVTVIGADPGSRAERPPDSISGVAGSVLPSVVSISVG